jgi:hypothetical protein
VRPLVQKAPGQAIFSIANGAKNWSPDRWIAVRVMENEVTSALNAGTS